MEGGNPLLSPQAGTIIWTLITFGVLLVGLRLFAWKPVLGLLDERGSLLKAGRALLAQTLEVRFATRADEIRRVPEAIPEALRRIPRRFGDFLPFRVQLLQRAGRGGQVRFLPLLGFELEGRDDGLGHRDELFLTLRVGEASPFVHFAKLADAGRDLLLQCPERREGFRDFT